MNISEQWLREWVDPQLSTEQLSNQLTMLGLEVDEEYDVGAGLEGFLVGHIVDIQPHPDADKLQICQVDLGQETPQTIVCGAPNARHGLKVAVAPIGVTMPSGMKIKKAKLRGQESFGMLCSAEELGLSAANSGILELHPDAPVGVELVEYLGLPDHVFDIDLTPNRGDCLSLLGVARDVAVANKQTLEQPAIPTVAADCDDTVGVTIAAKQHSPGYAARCIVNINPQAKTPDWMAEKLRRAGVRPLHLPVDVANFVMLELGQPMHAFDRDKLQGDIRVRLAQAGEQLVALDGQEVKLTDDTLVIADDQGAVAVAGIIGGAPTAVSETTQNVVFEAASFTQDTVAGKARAYKIHTDSSHRYERGVDPELHTQAIERATQLLIELAGGQAGPVVAKKGEPVWSEQRTIKLTASHVERLLGQAVPADEIERILRALGMHVTGDAQGWYVVPPSWRFDINIAADLVEEVARVYGYDNLQEQAVASVLPAAELPRDVQHEDEVLATLRQRGYSEAITYSFVEPKFQAQLLGDDWANNTAAINLANPIANQYSQMRGTLWASLIPAWSYNHRRQFENVRLYERGLRFVADEQAEHGIAQIDTLASIIDGQARANHWSEQTRPIDFFDIKGDVEALLAQHGRAIKFVVETHPALHPGRCAAIYLGAQKIGWVGQLGPKFAKQFKTQRLPYVFEIDYQALAHKPAVRYEPISEQPRVERDLAVIVADKVSAAELIDCAIDAAAGILQDVAIFDVFKSDKLEKGSKSIALRLIFQDKTRTLTDADVDENIEQIITQLQNSYNARIRGI